MPIRVLLVDDHPLFLKGLHSILSEEPDLLIVGEATDGLKAIEKVRETSPDVIVMDISMPNMDGIEATQNILKETPLSKVLALSIHTGKRFVKKMLNSGASGYIPKDSAPDEIVKAIKTISEGQMYLSPSVVSVALSPNDEEVNAEWNNVLQTKLHRPGLSSNQVVRTSLIEQFSIYQEIPCSLISAPAGYGKSITVSQWLEQTKTPYIWLSLDEEHDKLRVFLMYIISAFEKIFPSQFSTIKAYLNNPELPTLQKVSTVLINEIEVLEGDFILVLDDYHRINDSLIHQLIDNILQYPPANMHLCIITRFDPPLNLHRLRLQNQLLEMRMLDLAFNKQEVVELLKKHKDNKVSVEAAERIHEKTEGWIVGLSLALLTIHNEEDAEWFLSNPITDMYSVSEFLLNEVLSKQAKEIQQALLICSAMDRFCADLIDAIFENTSKDLTLKVNGASFIEWLKKSNIFVISLGGKEKWYRFHHLFQELMYDQFLKKFRENIVKKVHIAASNWFIKEEYVNEGIHHALKAKDFDLTATIIGQKRYKIIDQDKWFVLKEWLQLLPKDSIGNISQANQSEILLTKAWDSMVHLNFAQIFEIIGKVEALFNDTDMPQRLKSELLFFKGLVAYFMTEGKQSEAFHLEARKLNESHSQVMLGENELHYALACQMNNKFEFALDFLQRTLKQTPKISDIRASRIWAAITYTELLEGHLNKALYNGRKLVRLSESMGTNFSALWGKYLEGNAYMLRNELPKAIELFTEILSKPYALSSRVAVDGYAGLILMNQMLGKTQEADYQLKSLHNLEWQNKNPDLDAVIGSLEVRLALLRGDIDFGISWVQSFDILLDQGLMLWWLEIPRTTRARVLIAQNTNESLSEAVETLEKLNTENLEVNNKIQRVGIHILLSLAYYKLAHNDKAIQLMVDAIKLYQKGKCIFPFIETGSPLIEILKKIKPTDIAENTISDLIFAIKNKANEEVQIEKVTYEKEEKKKVSVSNAQLNLITVRERQIINLLCKGLRNKEIADNLFVSEITIKKHLSNIFKKMEVKNRVSLINKINTLDLDYVRFT